MRLLCFRVLSACLLVLFAGNVRAQTNAAVVPAIKMDRKDPSKQNPGFLKRHESFKERIRQGNVDLLLIGDSITHGWERSGASVWDQYYAPRNAVNLGIGGDRTEHVLWRLMNGELEGIAPKVAVVMIGTNNTRANTPEQIAEGVAAICTLLREQLPKTKILLLAIFSRGEDTNNELRIVNEKTNAILAKLDDGKSITFLDINEFFLKTDGTLSKDIMPDLLHPNETGYQIWAKAMEPTLARLMGDTPVE